MVIIPIVAFTYDSAEARFSAEVSELPAFDEDTFAIFNPETGASRRFVRVSTLRDEGDIQFWEYVSNDGQFTAIVFND